MQETRKGTEKIKLGSLPKHAGQMVKWRMKVRRQIAQCTGWPDEGNVWALDVERGDVSFEELGIAAPFPMTDVKLGTACTDIMDHDMLSRANLEEHKAAKDRKQLTGRQMLRMIYDDFEISEQAGALYSFSDLNAIRMKTDDLRQFLYDWDLMLLCLKPNVRPNDNILYELFFEQVKDHVWLKIQMDRWKLLPANDPEKTYEEIRSLCVRICGNKRKERRRQDLLNASRKSGSATPVQPNDAQRKDNICISYQKYGKCSDGDRCAFKHEQGKGQERGRSQPRGGYDRSTTELKLLVGSGYKVNVIAGKIASSIMQNIVCSIKREFVVMATLVSSGMKVKEVALLVLALHLLVDVPQRDLAKDHEDHLRAVEEGLVVPVEAVKVLEKGLEKALGRNLVLCAGESVKRR